MKFAERNRIYLEKLRGLPENKKKIILWTIVVILGIIMGFFWVRGAITSFSKIGQNVSQIKLPKIDTSNMPTIDLNSILNTTTPSNAK